MENIKYILAGIMVGGAFGAKLGAYLISIMEWPNSFQWIQSGMLFGAITGLVLSMIMLASTTAEGKKTDRRYFGSNQKASMSGA